MGDVGVAEQKLLPRVVVVEVASGVIRAKSLVGTIHAQETSMTVSGVDSGSANDPASVVSPPESISNTLLVLSMEDFLFKVGFRLGLGGCGSHGGWLGSRGTKLLSLVNGLLRPFGLLASSRARGRRLLSHDPDSTPYCRDLARLCEEF
jgi:hypothetical protein